MLTEKITLRFASDGPRINGRQGPDVYNSLIGRPQRARRAKSPVDWARTISAMSWVRGGE